MAWEYVIFDIETDGLDPSVIHVLCMTCLVTWESKTFVGTDQVAEGLLILDNAKMVAGHAIKVFDCPVIEKLTEKAVIFPYKKTIDTLELSRHLTNMRANGLKAWGEKLGLPKLEQPPFDQGFDNTWIPYCERDVELNVKVFNYLLEKLIEKYGLEIPERYQALVEYVKEVYQ